MCVETANLPVCLEIQIAQSDNLMIGFSVPLYS